MEMRVTGLGLVVGAARPPRCQIAEVILALEGPRALRSMGDSLSHLQSSGNRVTAVVVNCDAVEALGNASDDHGRLREDWARSAAVIEPMGVEGNLRERRRGDHDLSSRLRLLERRRGGLLRRRSR